MNIDSVVAFKPNPNIPEILPGDTVRVSARIIEGDKQRTQAFQGVVIRIRRGGAGASFTVRRLAYGVGVERTFPVYSPTIEKVEVVRHGKVRRAKLYYLRGLSGKASRIKERRAERVTVEGEEPVVEPVETTLEQPVAENAGPVAEQKPEQPSARTTDTPVAQKSEPPSGEKAADKPA